MKKKKDTKLNICEEVGQELVDELTTLFQFNLDDGVGDEMKQKNVVVCGYEKSGKKTVVRRAIQEYIYTRNNTQMDDIMIEEVFSFKQIKLAKESVRT